jgi:uncharacterized membrane protein YccC
MSEVTQDQQETTVEQTADETTTKVEQTVPLATLKKAEKEAKAVAAKLKAYEEAEEARKQAEMTEVERYKAEAEKLQQELAETQHRTLIESRKTTALSIAQQAGIASPQLATRLIDLEAVEDEASIAEAVNDLVTAYPELRGVIETPAPNRVGATSVPRVPVAGTSPVNAEDAEKQAAVNWLTGKARRG